MRLIVYHIFAITILLQKNLPLFYVLSFHSLKPIYMNGQDYSIPNFTPKEISEYFSDLQLNISPINIQKPNAQIVQQTFEQILSTFANVIITEHLKENENFESQYILYIHKFLKQFMSEINVKITLKDIIAPEPKRFITILSNVMNFGMYRETNKEVYERLIKMCQEKEEMKEGIEDKISDALKNLENLEMAANREIQEVAKFEEAVNALEEDARNEYKGFRVLSSNVQNLKEKKNTESDRESSNQLLIIQAKQEIVRLKSQIVSDPARFFELLNEMKEMLVKEKQQIKQLEERREMLKKNIAYLEDKKEEIKNLIRKKKSIQNSKIKLNELNKIIKLKEMELAEDDKNIQDLNRKVEVENKKLKNINEKIKNLDLDMMHAGDELNKKMSNLKIQYTDIKSTKEKKTETINDYNEKTKILEQQMMQEMKQNADSIRQLRNEIDEIKDVINDFYNSTSLTFE